MRTCYLQRFVHCYYLFTSTNSYYFRYPIIVPGMMKVHTKLPRFDWIILLIFIVVFMSTYLNFNFINFTQPVSNLSSTYALRLILLINLPNDNLHRVFFTLFIISTGHATSPNSFTSTNICDWSSLEQNNQTRVCEVLVSECALI